MTTPVPVTVVVLTHRRRESVLRTLAQLGRLPERPAIVLVDNGSADGTVDAVRRAYPQVTLIAMDRNLGAAARNAGVRAASTPYVALCDHDTWWQPGSLARGCALLDAHPGVAAVTARVLVGPTRREHPTSALMARSPLHDPALPVPVVAGLMAGACLLRREAFLAAGGFEPGLLPGTEERLLTIDLMAVGWRLVYTPELVVIHVPSPPARDPRARRLAAARNRLWTAWMRRSSTGLWRDMRRTLREARDDGVALPALLAALRRLPWALARRRPIPGWLEHELTAVDEDADAARRPS